MKYQLIQGSEENCVVLLGDGGLLNVIPVDPMEEYYFEYYEINEFNGQKERFEWYSEDETSDVMDLSTLSKDEKKPDSNLRNMEL